MKLIKLFFYFIALFFAANVFAVPPVDSGFVSSTLYDLNSTAKGPSGLTSCEDLIVTRPMQYYASVGYYEGAYDCPSRGSYGHPFRKILVCAPSTKYAGTKTIYKDFDCGPETQPQECLAGFKLNESDNTCKPDCSNAAGELNESWRKVCGEPSKCSSKKDQSSGNVNVPIPSGVCSSGTAAITNKEQAKNWLKSPMNSCNDGCITKSSGTPNTSSPTQCDTAKGILYLSVPSSYTGETCNSSPSVPNSVNSSPSSPDFSVPQSQNDCPSGTTFGAVNDRPMCVKNAPSPNASGVPQATVDDGKACVGNCDKWSPSGQPDTSNGKEGSGHGVDGDGQQGPSKEGGGTQDTSVEAEDEEGEPVSGNNAGFGSVKQDEIYKSKYKDISFGKIWDSKKDSLFNTPFLKGLTSSMPTFGTGGAAPVYTMNFSALKLGSHSFDIDPRIWLFIKACILLTATFTARKIIWG